jgi:hypothetical protein
MSTDCGQLAVLGTWDRSSPSPLDLFSRPSGDAPYQIIVYQVNFQSGWVDLNLTHYSGRSVVARPFGDAALATPSFCTL